MGPYKGDYPTAFAPPLVFLFSTFSSDDPSASIALSGIAVTDIEVYKNGVATTRSSDAGYVLLDTDGIDFDSHVGIGGFSIDIDNDTDTGFFAAGQEYDVILASITVDGATVNFHAGSFSIERAGGVLALLIGTNSLANIEDKIDIIDTNVDQIETAVITNAAGTDVAADIIAIKAETVLIVEDTDLIDDGTSGLAKIATDVAAVLVDTGTTLDAALAVVDTNVDQIETAVITNAVGADVSADIATAQADLDIITGASGVVIADGLLTNAKFAADSFDDLFVRDVDAVEASAPLHSITTAILKAVSRVRDNAGTLETYRTDGTTVHMSQTVTADATLDPVDELTAGV